MAVELTMPQLGLTMTEGTVSKWLKKAGDKLKQGDEVVEVETDKINNIIEAPEDGVLIKIIAEEGAILPVKGILGYIGNENEVVAEDNSTKRNVDTVEVVEKNIGDDSKKRIVVIGGGPGGYVTAIRAAQLGASVSLVEENKLGGTCLNVGCIPTKALIHASSAYETLKRDAELLGIQVSAPTIDWKKTSTYKDSVVNRLAKGVSGLLAANGIKVYKGHAEVVDAHCVEVDGEKIEADYIIIASGSEPVSLKIPGIDSNGVIDSTGALSLEELPESMIIIGGGVIGIEFASMFASVGVKCTIVEALPYILPPIDKEIVESVRIDLEQRGLEVLVNTKVKAVIEENGKLRVQVDRNGEDGFITGDKIVVAVGRRPKTDAKELERVGVKTERGRIVTDDRFRTSVPSIFAIGDCNGKLMLAHAASAQGVAAVETIMTGKSHYSDKAVPSCIYLEPEVASVGMKEEDVQAAGIPYNVGKFSLAGNGKSLIENGGKGLIKIIADKKYGEILGVHLYGPRVTELISACVLAIQLEATVDELIDCVWAHPSVSESIGEAAEAVCGNAIHWPPK